jgi:predicted nucleic acid-binding Zn ribbon protein
VIAGGAGLIFKGSGFYITDYRSESYKEAARKESGTTAPKAESKPSGAPAEAKSAPPAKSPDSK